MAHEEMMANVFMRRWPMKRLFHNGDNDTGLVYPC